MALFSLVESINHAQAGGWNISGAFDVKTWDLQSSLQIYHNQYNRGGLFSWAVGADERNSTRNIIQLDQGGLGLPSRDYYLNKTDKNVVSSFRILGGDIFFIYSSFKAAADKF